MRISEALWAEKIVDFAIVEGGKNNREFTDRRTYSEIIEKHLLYKTIVLCFDAQGLSGFCRFNYLQPNHIEVIDMVIARRCRNQKMIVNIAKIARKCWPCVEKIKFERVKNPGKIYAWDITKLIKERA